MAVATAALEATSKEVAPISSLVFSAGGAGGAEHGAIARQLSFAPFLNDSVKAASESSGSQLFM